MYNKNNKKEVTIKDIASLICSKTGIPLYEILKDNKKAIYTIKTVLLENIIGQNEVINRLVDITKRIKLGYKDNKCISLLFVGPSGVGKTKLATLFASLISKQKVIKLDMSEYSDNMALSKFIGSTAGYIGYEDNKYALNIIKDNPNSVIILDEIDKAHPKIINLLYQILEDAQIKDAKNNIINFSNNIIIMTSNAGEEQKNIGFNQNNAPDTKLKETFDTPFINRIDDIIKFNHLTEENIHKIILKDLKELKNKYQEITINIDNEVINELIKESNYKEYGARRINKIIKNKIESTIIDNIIEEKKEVNIISIFQK